MRPKIPLPLDVAVILLGFCILLQVSERVRAEAGSRHIRRITAADLPSSNTTVTPKVRLKKFSVKDAGNCTKSETCYEPTTEMPHSTTPIKAEGTSKMVSSFVADDVLQERLHGEVLSLLTTTPSYDGSYDSYLEDIISADNFDDSVAKKTSPFRNEYLSETGFSNYNTPLTTPRISLFDDVHTRVTEGIIQNLEDLNEHRFRDITIPKNEGRYQSKTDTRQKTSVEEPKEKTSETLAVDFLSNYSLVYNDSRSPHSVSRDRVTENGTHLDVEKSRIHTKVYPEVNKTVSYVINDTHTTIFPIRKENSEHEGNSSSNTEIDQKNSDTKLSTRGAASSGKGRSSHLSTVVSTDSVQNNTVTPGNKESTTSEPSKDRSYSRSQSIKYISKKDKPSVSNVTEVTLNAENSSESQRNSSKGDEVVTVNNAPSTVTKDPESNAVAPVSTEGTTRSGRTLTSRRPQDNTTNGLEQSSQNPVSGSSNSFTGEVATKKSRERYPTRRIATNKTEEVVESSTESFVSTTEKTILKLPVSNNSSSETPEYNEGIAQTTTNITTQKNNRTNVIQGDVNETEASAESSTIESSPSSRARAFSHRRPYTAAINTTRDYETSTRSGDYLTTRPFTGGESSRRRLSTLRRRPQSSTESSVTPSNSSITESNTIARVWPVVRRPTASSKISSNQTSLNNTEGNDILYSRNNVFKSTNRHRGSVRYGTQKNVSSEVSASLSNDTSFPIPPTAIAWTLVTLKEPANETRTVRQPVRENNSTSNESANAHTRPGVRWPPTRGRRPSNAEENESSSVASNEEIASTSPNPSNLSAIGWDKQMTRIRNSYPSKKTQQSSMQENRLSTVHVAAPVTEETNEESVSSTIRNNDEALSTSPLPVISTETDFTISTENTSDWSYTTSLFNSTSQEVTTSFPDKTQDSISTTTYSPSALQVTTTVSSLSTEDAITSTTEPTENVTTNSDLLTTDSENSTTLRPSPYELLAEVSPSIDNQDITSTTESSYQSTSSSVAFVTAGPQSGVLEEVFNVPKKDYNDHQHHDGHEVEPGFNAEVANNAGESNSQLDESKQGESNADGSQQDDGPKHVSGEDTRGDEINSGVAYNQGDNPVNSSEEDENKNPDDSQISGKIHVTPGEEPYPANDDSQDYGNPENIAVNNSLSAEITTNIPVPNHTDSTTVKGIEESQTSGTTSTEKESIISTTWSSSTSAIDWNAEDTTTLSSAAGVPFYLVLTISSTWREFCDHIDHFKQSVVNLMRNNNRVIATYQIMLPNVEGTSCQNDVTARKSKRSSTIKIEMYFVDGSISFDHQLTMDFYNFWRHSGLPDFPFEVNSIQPGGQTTVASTDDGGGGNAGMIAAISISCIGAVCLLLLAVLWLVMRKRQQRFNYGQRCTPVSLDAYSLDSVSVCGSVRRKGGVRNSKRSYGNAAFDDPASPSHPMGFAGLANFISNRNALEEEFASIPQVTVNVDEIPEGADTKNRYSNVIPLPETRVQLSPVEGEPLSEYINANYVHGPKKASKYYIACQAPLTSTVTDFWRMIWEQQSKVILMLTDLVENGVEKSADYLPPSEVLDCHRLFGDFQITLKKREVKEKYIISTLQLKNLETNSWREVMHLWFVSWPGKGVPDDLSSVIAFLLEARPYMRGGPCVVHCSPGTGRTGTVLACDLCIRDFETTRIVDIPRCVTRLRRDRAGAVQTRDQYVFIYQVINFYGSKLTGGALDSM